MDKIKIKGGRQLNGEIFISGAKNAALPLICASLLTEETVTLTNMPILSDIKSMNLLLEQLGTQIDSFDDFVDGHPTKTYSYRTPKLTSIAAPYDYVRKMRASYYVLGPLLARAGKVELSLPGGCAIGTRPMDIHLAAREEMGAKISGIGTSILTIEGVEKLHGARHKVIPDRIEAGSYAVAAAITGGKIELINAQTYTLKTPMQILQKMGVEVVPTERGILVDATGKKLIGEDIITEPFPGFPTDLQAQFMALLTMAEGAGMVTETIFENRFMHVPELLRMGANINVHGHASAIVRGVKKLSGAPVMATDLRASFALVLAGLAAEGETVVNRVYHLDRGYEKLEEKLKGVGADIERVKEDGEE